LRAAASVRKTESQTSAQTSTNNFVSCEQGQHSQTVSAALTGQPEKFAGNTTHMARSWAATDVLTATIAISPVLRPFFHSVHHNFGIWCHWVYCIYAFHHC